jgi:hypothetical protein
MELVDLSFHLQQEAVTSTLRPAQEVSFRQAQRAGKISLTELVEVTQNKEQLFTKILFLQAAGHWAWSK